jgi:hypothetical protein
MKVGAYEYGRILPPIDKVRTLCAVLAITHNELFYGAQNASEGRHADANNGVNERSLRRHADLALGRFRRYGPACGEGATRSRTMSMARRSSVIEASSVRNPAWAVSVTLRIDANG